MSCRRASWLKLLCLLGALACVAGDKKSPPLRLDLQGDPLPSAALGRLGSARLQHHDSVGSVLFSPDGKRVISGSFAPLGNLPSSNQPHSQVGQAIRVWDASTGKLLEEFGSHRGGAFKLALSPSGKVLASRSGGSVYLWDLDSNSILRRLEQDAPSHGNIAAFTFSPDGGCLASIGPDRIHVWDVKTGKQLGHFGEEGFALAYSPDGKALCDGTHFWDPVRGKKLRSLPAGPARRSSVAFSPKGELLATGDEAGCIQLWETSSGRALGQMQGQQKEVHALAFSPNGKVLASAGKDGSARLWQVATRRELFRIPASRTDIYTLAFSPDGTTLATAGADHQVRLWEIATGKERLSSLGHRHLITCLAFSPRGKVLASGGFDNTVRLWEPGRQLQLRHLPQEKDAIDCLAFSPDGKLLAWASGEGGIRLCDPVTGKERSLEGHGDTIECLAFSPDGRVLASVGADPSFRVWDVTSGKELVRLPRRGSEGKENYLSFSPDGRLLACGGEKIIHLWDWARKREVRQLKGHQDEVLAVVFSPDGKMLTSAGREQTIRLWQVDTGKEVRSCQGHQVDALRSMVFSPDGRLLASVSDFDASVRLMEAASGQEVECFQGHEEDASAVAFSADGRQLASASKDQTILLWDVTGSLSVNTAQQRGASKKDLEHLWKELASPRAATAHRAGWQMVRKGDSAVTFLRERLRPVIRPQLERLIADLDSEEFAVRERAEGQLLYLDELAVPALRGALRENPTLEVRRRVERLLAKLEQPTSPERLRFWRAVAILEHVGTQQARDVLKDVAGGAAQAHLTREAKASLDRLNRPQAHEP